MNIMTVGQRIKQRRLELGLTQEELARKMGNKTRASVCTVERDKEQLTIERIKKYAEALECEPGYLTGWVGNDSSPSTKIDYVVEAEIPLAIEIYEKYKNAPPEIQAAVEILLKRDK